jgi:hypothetical protein
MQTIMRICFICLNRMLNGGLTQAQPAEFSTGATFEK